MEGLNVTVKSLGSAIIEKTRGQCGDRDTPAEIPPETVQVRADGEPSSASRKGDRERMD